MVKLICINDGVEFEAARSTAQFCSPKCRVEYNRKNPVIRGENIGAPVKKSLEKLRGVVATQKEELNKPYDREAQLAAFQKMGLDPVSWITTGIPELDAFQMIPRGRVTQIQGPYSVGKTTLALNMLKGLSDKKVLYIDSEASLNPHLLVDLELRAENFTLYNESAFIEDIYEVLIKSAGTGEYDLIIFDSLASCTTKTEEANDAAARNIGGKALIVNKMMRIVPMMLKNSDTALVIINQEREMIGTYVPTKYTPGGMGPLYAASLILALKTIPSWRFPKDAKNGAYKGHEIEVTVAKSKVSRPHRKAKIKLYYQNTDGASESNILGDDEPEEVAF